MTEHETQPTEGPGQQARRIADGIVARLREAGFEALLAGGSVRDRLLHRDPVDHDVATSASARDVQRLFPHTVGVGAQFGVMLVIQEGVATEVATFRRDGAYLDHRHPIEVHFSDVRDDASRRDFTINGMYLDPDTDEVLDFVGGQADLAAGLVRAIGDPMQRFEEDRLRLLRAVRLAARLGYEIEPATREAIVRLAPSIREMAWERIGDEIVKILTEGAARRGFELLLETGLLEHVLPEVQAMRGVAQSPDYHPEGDVLEHTLRCLSQLERGRHDETMGLAVLLHDVGKPPCATRDPDGRIHFYGHCERGAEMAREICRRLRRSRETGEKVGWLVEHHLRHVNAPSMRVATLKRFLAEPLIDELLELVRIDSLSASGNLEAWQFCMQRKAELSTAEVRPPLLVRGRDLIEMGYAPGPRFKQILEDAFDAQLEGKFTSTDDGREWVLRHHPPGDDRTRS